VRDWALDILDQDEYWGEGEFNVLSIKTTFVGGSWAAEAKRFHAEPSSSSAGPRGRSSREPRRQACQWYTKIRLSGLGR
jgi:hypothetical protein